MRRISLRNPLIRFIIISCLLIAYHHLTVPCSKSPRSVRQKQQKLSYISNRSTGWISPLLFDELNVYIQGRNYTNQHYTKMTHIINNKTVTSLALDYQYIIVTQSDQNKTFPFSTWKCSLVSNTNYKEGSEYCVLTNIYYQSSTNQYYFFENSLEKKDRKTRNIFMASDGQFKLNVTDQIAVIKSLNHSAILIRPNLITHPSDDNYIHGFLETCGPRFWVLAECQSHPLYVDPTRAQIYYTSRMFDSFPSNWKNYFRQSDGTYVPRRQWEQMLQSMFSIYPLLTYRSFNRSTVLFQHMLFTSVHNGRTAAWGHYYSDRPFKSYPFPTAHYRRVYLAYSEWILNKFNLTSKFQLTPVQEQLQRRQLTEQIRICNKSCVYRKQKNISLEEFSGEWIVVVNRAGVGRREMKNSNELISRLLEVFPDHSNPHLRVWPSQFNFNANLYETARMARSIRLLIGVHGAGLSNAIFMRPGTILYEINPYGCRHLSFYYHRWAEVFNLQHALWIPSQGDKGTQNNICHREAPTILNVKEIIDEVKNMLKNEAEYRSGYIRRALNIMSDLSTVDHPPAGFEDIL